MEQLMQESHHQNLTAIQFELNEAKNKIKDLENRLDTIQKIEKSNISQNMVKHMVHILHYTCYRNPIGITLNDGELEFSENPVKEIEIRLNKFINNLNKSCINLKVTPNILSRFSGSIDYIFIIDYDIYLS